MSSIIVLASTKYFLDAVKPSRSESKGITSAAANLDSMIDMESNEAKDDTEVEKDVLYKGDMNDDTINNDGDKNVKPDEVKEVQKLLDLERGNSKLYCKKVIHDLGKMVRILFSLAFTICIKFHYLMEGIQFWFEDF